MKHQQRVVTLGGGTGSAVVLSGLKRYLRNLTAVVSVFDDGGSSGMLRRELAVLPPGDIRQCLAALSPQPEMRELLNYRFDTGVLTGHSLGNVMLAAGSKIFGDMNQSIRHISSQLQSYGRVLPVTLNDAQLVAELRDGTRIVGEVAIWAAALPHKYFSLRLEPAPPANPYVLEAIHDADIIVICPGSFYTSILPNLLVEGIGPAVSASRALKILIVNLTNKAGQTHGYFVRDYVAEIEARGGFTIDLALCNTAPLSLLDLGDGPDMEAVRLDGRDVPSSFSPVTGDFLSRNVSVAPAVDMLHPSVVRHDPDRTARAILAAYASR